MEKTLIEGKFKKANILSIICAIFAGILFIYSFWWNARAFAHFKSMPIQYYTMNFARLIKHGFKYDYFSPFLFVGLPLLILAIVFRSWLSRCKITITDKRVFGKAAFGKRVDLPFDMISAVGSGAFKSIAVSTSSGKIKFYLLKNRDEVFDVIAKHLIARQDAKISATPNISQDIPQSNADELKKFKELFDSGVITQEEFDAKKKQLLGL